MFRKPFLFMAAGLLLLPSQLIAGGPPWLCLPIDGVTSDTAQNCASLINAKLDGQIFPRYEDNHGAMIRRDGAQNYLAFHMQQDVRLSDVEAALVGSDFSIPRDKLRLFGHVVLEIEAGKTTAKDLIAALDAIDHVAIAKSETAGDHLQVTVQMPYPVAKDRPKPDALGWKEFVANDYRSEQPPKSDSPALRHELPTYSAIREAVAKQHAKLTDARWSTEYACRALGCVVAPSKDAVVAKANVAEETSLKSN